MRYADIAVDATTPQKTYTYAVPHRISLSRGQAVWVPFGRSSRLTQGIAFEFSDETDLPSVKDVHSIIEAQPLLGEVQCDLAIWLSNHYFAPLFDCAALFMPPGFRQRVRTTVALKALPPPEVSLPKRAVSLLEYLEQHPEPHSLDHLSRMFGPNIEIAARTLGRYELAAFHSEFERPRTGPKFVRRVTLTPAGMQEDIEAPLWRRRTRQREALELLRHRPEGYTLPELREALEALSSAVLDGLERQGLIALTEERVTRDPLAGRAVQTDFAPTLTAGQAEAVQGINATLGRTEDGAPRHTRDGAEDSAQVEEDRAGPAPVILLHGVTGSGKTEVYLRAVEARIAAGQRAIVLVPEIALEPQTVARFSARFPGKVAILHSGLTAGEAYDEWWRIREGEFDVVIGPRSALFAPLPNLGLIVVDEEHEPTYKQQDPAPRYHARAVALRLAEALGATVVLGSATPDLETSLHTIHKQYQLFSLPDRPGTAGQPGALPSVEVVDLRTELKAGNRSIFSRGLQAALVHTLRSNQQAVLFLNRRGAATFVQCRDCGAVIRCRRCESPMTYHSAREQLQCHQCNLRRQVPQRCPDCGSARIKFLGVGTQRVEQEVSALLPSVRVMRWDRDTTAARGAHLELLERFAAHEADVLVGTQMIAKGLDLPQVTLVGVINADVNLYVPDFRAAERTFQLLTQVAGRAGRGPHAGQVIIQTYTPDHYAITSAARQDCELFSHHELAFRHRHGYPPFQPLIRLLYPDVNNQRAQQEATTYARLLSNERAQVGLAEVTVTGALPSYFRKVRGRFRWQVLLKGKGGHQLLERCPPPRGWIVDVDPLHVL